jgi:shikimate kinase
MIAHPAQSLHPGPAIRLAIPRTVVLVGLMGAGKTSIGRRLAARLDLPFRDADHEIESAAGCTIEEIFERYGEEEFRSGERRVIGRLLQEETPHVLATGGGAYMDPVTRALIRDHGIAIWLRASSPPAPPRCMAPASSPAAHRCRSWKAGWA